MESTVVLLERGLGQLSVELAVGLTGEQLSGEQIPRHELLVGTQQVSERDRALPEEDPELEEVAGDPTRPLRGVDRTEQMCVDLGEPAGHEIVHLLDVLVERGNGVPHHANLDELIAASELEGVPRVVQGQVGLLLEHSRGTWSTTHPGRPTPNVIGSLRRGVRRTAR